MTIVEIYPGGGWYQEILAPYLNKNGQYISATYDPDSEEQTTKDRYQSEKDRLSAKKNIYGNAKITQKSPKTFINKKAPERRLFEPEAFHLRYTIFLVLTKFLVCS